MRRGEEEGEGRKVGREGRMEKRYEDDTLSL